jgi:DNA-directed RNA polymerase specialized sigma24 family protein
MTTDTRAALLQMVSNPTTLRKLASYVRRRGGGQDSEDVVQNVLCDLLAVQNLPSDPDDLPRFVNAIARRRVVDEHRRRARIGGDAAREPSTSIHPEVRDLLARIDQEAEALGQRGPLTCMLREHAGETLLEVAREQALNPTTLRQRICRLRRALRTRYLGALVMLLVGGGALALVDHGLDSRTPSVAAASGLARYEGTWRVVDASKKPSIGVEVSFHAGIAKVRGAGGIVQRTLSVERESGDRLRLEDAGSTWIARTQSISDERVRLESERGFVVLERVR